MFSDFVQRANQVTLDVVGEGFDGRDVNGVYFLFQLLVKSQSHQLVDNREKRRQGLTRTGRRTKKQVVLVHNCGNGEFLGTCKIRKFIPKPLTNGRAKPLIQRLGFHWRIQVNDFCHLFFPPYWVGAH